MRNKSVSGFRSVVFVEGPPITVDKKTKPDSLLSHVPRPSSVVGLKAILYQAISWGRNHDSFRAKRGKPQEPISLLA